MAFLLVAGVGMVYVHNKKRKFYKQTLNGDVLIYHDAEDKIDDGEDDLDSNCYARPSSSSVTFCSSSSTANPYDNLDWSASSSLSHIPCNDINSATIKPEKMAGTRPRSLSSSSLPSLHSNGNGYNNPDYNLSVNVESSPCDKDKEQKEYKIDNVEGELAESCNEKVYNPYYDKAVTGKDNNIHHHHDVYNNHDDCYAFDDSNDHNPYLINQSDCDGNDYKSCNDDKNDNYSCGSHDDNPYMIYDDSVDNNFNNKDNYEEVQQHHVYETEYRSSCSSRERLLLQSCERTLQRSMKNVCGKTDVVTTNASKVVTQVSKKVQTFHNESTKPAIKNSKAIAAQSIQQAKDKVITTYISSAKNLLNEQSSPAIIQQAKKSTSNTVSATKKAVQNASEKVYHKISLNSNNETVTVNNRNHNPQDIPTGTHSSTKQKISINPKKATSFMSGKLNSLSEQQKSIKQNSMRKLKESLKLTM